MCLMMKVAVEKRYFMKSIALSCLFLSVLLAGCDDKDGNSGTNGPAMVYLWVSTQTTDGDMGGVEGADSICKKDAPDELAELKHRAVIRSRDRYFAGETVGSYPVTERPDGTVIVDSYSDFFLSGNEALASVNDRDQTYWYGLGVEDNCDNWTSSDASDEATVGRSNEMGRQRYGYDGGQSQNCNQSLHILCSSF